MIEGKRVPFKPFTGHPNSVGETYLQHMRVASGCGVRMVAGGLACLLHGLLPFLFTTAGTDQLRYLHRRMVENRVAGKDKAGPPERHIG